MLKIKTHGFNDKFSCLSNGTISLKEFYAHFGIEKTAFADRAFAVLDEDASGELDYHEFLAGVWSMCSSSKRDLVSFLFSLFDEDKSNLKYFSSE